MDYREALIQIYSKNDPSKLADVDRILKTYRGHEKALIKSLTERYSEAADTSLNKKVSTKTKVEALPVQEKAFKTNTSVSPALTSIAPSSVAPSLSTISRAGNPKHISSALEEMQWKLKQMQAVDVAALTDRLLSAPPSSDNNEVLIHTLNFIQFFSQQATDFLSLANQVSKEYEKQENFSAPPPARPVDPRMKTDRGSTPIRLSPVRRAGTKTPTPVMSPSPRAPGRYPRSEEDASYGDEGDEDVDMRYSSQMDEVDAGVTSKAGSVLRPFSMPARSPSSVSTTSSRATPRDSRVPGISTLTTLDIEPYTAGCRSVVGEALRDGGRARLETGIYYENLNFSNGEKVEIVAAVPGSPVVFRPFHTKDPLIVAKGPSTRLTVVGVIFVFGELTQFEADHDTYQPDLSLPGVPLVSVLDGAQVMFEGCHFYKGGAVGVLTSGGSTVASLHSCFFSMCAFGAVFARDHSSVDMKDSRFRACESGLRLSTGARAFLAHSTIERCATDGVVVHEGSEAYLSGCSVTDCGGDGVSLSGGAVATLEDSVVEGNHGNGIHRSAGSKVHLMNSFIRNNALSSIGE